MNKRLYIYCLSIISMLVIFPTSCSGKNSKDMNASEIIKLVKSGKDVLVNDKVIHDDLDFTTLDKYYVMAFPNMEAHIPVNIMFSNCVFMGKVSTTGKTSVKGAKRKIDVFTVFEKNLTFFDCDFRGEVMMDNMTVEGKLECSKSVFREQTSINSLYVKGSHVGFVEMESEKDFSMCYARFLCDANFVNAKFAGRANFLGMNVEGLQFSNAEFGQEVDFSNSIFSGDVIFNYVNCAKRVQYSFSKYQGDFDFIKSVCQGDVSFERSIFLGRIRLNKSQFDANVELKDVKSFCLPETDEVKLPSDTLKWNVAKMTEVILK